MSPRRPCIAALAVLLAASSARAWLSSSIKEHQRVNDELQDANSQIKYSLAATKALQAFNTGIFALRTATVSAMQAQAASINCSVNFPGLYQQDNPAGSMAAQTRAKSQMKPLRSTAEKLEEGLDKIAAEAQPLADELRGEDMAARKMIGGKGSPSGDRADSLIADIDEATRIGLDVNRKGDAAQKASVAAAEAAQNAAKMETQAADKNDEISNKLNGICQQIKSLPKNPASIGSAVSMASQGLSLHSGGMAPITQAGQAILQAERALTAAKEAAEDFRNAIPGNARPPSADLPYATKLNDISKKLEAREKEYRRLSPPVSAVPAGVSDSSGTLGGSEDQPL